MKVTDTVTDKEHEYHYKRGGFYLDDDRDKIRQLAWQKMDADYRKTVKSFLTNTREMGANTFWKSPLDMAMSLKPAPKTIIFLTDGTPSNQLEPDQVKKDVAKKARRSKTVIKTIALMEPAAKEALIDLAKVTRGSFTLVTGTGEDERETEDFSGSRLKRKKGK